MIYQVDKGLHTFFKERTELDSDRIFMSSNAWSFRNRLRLNKELDFPFLSFRVSPGGIKQPGNTYHQNFASTTLGVWEPYLKDRVQIVPYFADYEAVFWSNSFTNSMALFETFYKLYNQDLLFNYSYNIGGEEETFEGRLSFTNLEMDPQWNEEDELQKARLHSVDLGFQVQAYNMYGQDVIPLEGIILEAYSNGQFITETLDYTNEIP